MLHHKANLNGYLSYHTGQSLEKINQDTDRDFFMSAKEAKEYGLIDGVIMNPLKALQPLAAAEESADKSATQTSAESWGERICELLLDKGIWMTVVEFDERMVIVCLPSYISMLRNFSICQKQ